MRVIQLAMILLMVISCQSEKRSGGAYVDLSVSSDTATIGDVVNFYLEVYDPEGRQVLFFGSESGQEWEFKDLKEFPGLNKVNKMDLSIVFWDTGHFSIPPLAVGLISGIGDTSIISTDTTDIFIRSVLNADDNSMMPIKGPVPLKWSLSRNVILLLILIALTGIFLWVLLSKRVKKRTEPESFVKKPVISDPVEHALHRLRELVQNPRSDQRENYFILTHLIREFMEGLFYVRTLEMTTGEIVSKRYLLNRINDNDFESLRILLSKADGVKFARQASESLQYENDLKFTEAFILSFKNEESKQ